MHTDHRFALQPFESLPQLVDLAISGEISRRGERLMVRYALQGPLDTVLMAPPAQQPCRLVSPKPSPGCWSGRASSLCFAVLIVGGYS